MSVVAQQFNILIVVNPKPAVDGAGKVKTGLDKVGKAANKLRKLLRNVFVIVGISSLIRSVTELADTFLRVQNRIRVVTDGTAQLEHVTAELFRISRQTRSEFSATAELYSRLAINSRELGRNQSELLQFTKSLNQAILVSGASAKEANSGLIQLSQGLASGVLRGDELRSVLEQLPTVADTIATHMGITRGELRAMGQEGKITSEIVVDAFLEAGDTLEEKFGKTIPTLGQSFIVLRNRLLQWWGAVESATKVGQKFAQVVLLLADNIEVLARSITAASFALGVAFAKKAVPAAVAGIKTLTAALIGSGWGAIVVAIGLVIGVLISFGDKISATEGGLVSVHDILRVVWEDLKELGELFLWAGSQALAALGPLGEKIAGLELNFRTLALAVAVVLDAIIVFPQTVVGMVIAGFTVLVAGLFQLITNLGNKFIWLAELIIDAFRTAFNSVKSITKKFMHAFFMLWNSMGIAMDMTMSGQFKEAATITSEAVELFSAQMLGTVANVPATIEKEWGKLRAEDLIGKFENPMRDIWENSGNFMKAAFAELTADTPVADWVTSVFERAQEEADKKQLNLGMGVGGDPEGPGVGEPAVTGLATASEKLASMERETEVMREILAATSDLNNAEHTSIEIGQRAAEMAAIREEFRKANVDLTNQEVTALLQKIDAQLAEQQALAAQQSLLEEIRGPQEELITKFTALEALYTSGAISLEEYNNKLGELNVKQAELGTDLGSGITRGLAQVKDNLTDVASAAENALVNAFNSAEDALVEFATTGKVDMRSMAQSMLKDIARVISKMLILKAIEAMGGEGGGLFGSLLGSGGGGTAGEKAMGGPVAKNQPYLVGEEGPEIFVPSTGGGVMSHDATMAALGTNKKSEGTVVNVTAPPATVQVVNVSDPDEVSSALETPGGEQAVLNVIQRNPALIKRSIS